MDDGSEPSIPNIANDGLNEEDNLEGLAGQIEVLMQPAKTLKFSTKKKRPSSAEMQYSNETIILRGVELTAGQKDAFEYLTRKKVDEFLSFLMSHILTKVPDDPFSFIISLLDRCIEFRDGDGDPPLLFDPQHQEMVYRSMDPKNVGKISYQQYCNGLATMGIQKFSSNIQRTSDNMVTRKDFLEEADKILIDNLWEMLCPRKRSKDETEIILSKDSSDSTEFTIGSSKTPSMASESAVNSIEGSDHKL